MRSQNEQTPSGLPVMGSIPGKMTNHNQSDSYNFVVTNIQV